ncbi:hypothetical protein FRC17_008296, partial [Serendipita sp. 399]
MHQHEPSRSPLVVYLQPTASTHSKSYEARPARSDNNGSHRERASSTTRPRSSSRARSPR